LIFYQKYSCRVKYPAFGLAGYPAKSVSGASLVSTVVIFSPERIKCLIEAVLLGRDIDKHQCLAVAAQAVLQQVGQLGVPVGHVGALDN
jgi:hypothetical protein